MSSGDQKLLNVEADDLAENIKALTVDDEKQVASAKKACESPDKRGGDVSKPAVDETKPRTHSVERCKANDPTSLTSDDASVSETCKRPKKSRIYDKYSYPCLPKINCPEKIIFCIDMSTELEEMQFKKNDGSQHSALNMVKRTIEFFVHNKNFMNKKHEFSLMVLYESATWVREFTSNVVDFIDSLEDLNETQVYSSCDLASIVQLVSEKFELPLPVTFTSVPFIVRIVLVYGRSNCMFHFSDGNLQELLMRHPLMFMDILYIHEPPSEQNKCKEIYDALCDLDEQNKSYIFEVTSNITKLHNCMAKFLAHPLQRSAQKDTCYKIRPIEP